MCAYYPILLFSLSAPHFRPRLERPQFNPRYNYVASSTNTTNTNMRDTTAYTKPDQDNNPFLRWIKENYSDKKKAFDVIHQLHLEAKVWLKSSLWRFSSRSLFPGGRLLEPWIDQSFEEIRWLQRCMIQQDQDHVFRKEYGDYMEKTQRQLNGLSKLNLDTIISLKPYIDECVASAYVPTSTLPNDINMIDDHNNSTWHTNLPSTTSIANDGFLPEERAAFENDIFELGEIPVHGPLHHFS
ncbi:hypothetical protein I4U23_002133 [Adineta vaga]|nr:hypothetical protein I4U23_002133 [Adineta vaga]